MPMTALEHTRCEDTDGGGNPFDCSGEATHKVLKAQVKCAGAGCNATVCCGKCWMALLWPRINVFGCFT